MDFMTRDVFDTLILVIIVVGGALAVVRLYNDLTRPLPDESNTRIERNQIVFPPVEDDDTRPNQPVKLPDEPSSTTQE